MNGESRGGRSEVRFASKRELWVVLLVWTLVVALLIVSADIARSPMASWVKYTLEFLFLALAVFAVWTLYGTHYTVMSDRLLARCGPFKYEVPLHSIVRITPSRDPSASPALSLDRLHIGYRGSRTGLLISPERQREFLDAVLQRNSRLRQSDVGLETGR